MEEKIVEYFEKKYPGNEVNKNTVIMELIQSSIKFVESLCELEEELDIEIHLEEMDDITKVKIGDLENYIN